jgi:hypothetical protein
VFSLKTNKKKFEKINPVPPPPPKKKIILASNVAHTEIFPRHNAYCRLEKYQREIIPQKKECGSTLPRPFFSYKKLNDTGL